MEDASPIVFIGPRGIGKSTQAERLSKRFQLPLVSLDVLAGEVYCDDLYFNHCLDAVPHARNSKGCCEPHYVGSVLKMARDRLGAAYFAFEERLHAHCVERCLNDYAEHWCVLDFGAGHSAYNNVDLRRAVELRLAAMGNVILLQPCDNLMRSAEYLYRVNVRSEGSSRDQIVHELSIACDSSVASHILYVANRSEKEVHEEIISLFEDSYD
jgi:hypothetical protein